MGKLTEKINDFTSQNFENQETNEKILKIV